MRSFRLKDVRVSGLFVAPGLQIITDLFRGNPPVIEFGIRPGDIGQSDPSYEPCPIGIDGLKVGRENLRTVPERTRKETCIDGLQLRVGIRKERNVTAQSNFEQGN